MFPWHLQLPCRTLYIINLIFLTWRNRRLLAPNAPYILDNRFCGKRHKPRWLEQAPRCLPCQYPRWQIVKPALRHITDHNHPLTFAPANTMPRLRPTRALICEEPKLNYKILLPSCQKLGAFFAKLL